MRLLVNSHCSFFLSTFCLLLNFVSVTFIFSPPITLSQSNLMMANVTFALAKRSICLTFPPLPWCLFFFHRVVHHLSILAEGMQCAPSGLQISGEAFGAWSLARLPKRMNHRLLFILQLESADCNDGSFWSRTQMGPIKPTDFKSKRAFCEPPHKTMQPSQKN